MKETLQIINELQSKGIMKKFAIGGAIASIFYVEPIATFDLDIMIILPTNDKSLTPLAYIYDWARKNNYKIEKEHIVIKGVPVQFIPAYNDLVKEAVNNALNKNYEGVGTYVISPEYLVAIMLQTYRPKDKERLVRFFRDCEINSELLNEIIKKHNLLENFKDFNSKLLQ